MKKILIAIVVLCSLAACGKKEDPESPQPQITQSTAVSTVSGNEFNLTKAADALFRASMTIDKVCWASDNSDKGGGHLLVYQTSNWYELKNYVFSANDSNKTYFIEEVKDENLVKIFPDTTGIDCRSRS